MFYLKVNEPLQEDGKMDYKGLDLKKVRKSVYPSDIFNENFCILRYYGEEIIEHGDIQEITEQEYNDEKNRIESERPKNRAELLEEENAKMKQQQGDLIYDLMMKGVI